MQNLFRIFLGLTLLFSTVFAQKTTSKEICILYFNDLHGHLRPYRKHFKDQHNTGGVARLKKLIEKIRLENQQKNLPTLLLFAGDLLQGTVMSTIFQGEPDIQIMNLLQIDAACPGNHEFDFGLKNMKKICMEENIFPFVCTNLYQEKRLFGSNDLIYERLLPSFVLLNRGGVKVAVIGAITPDTKWTTHPKNVAEIVFTNPVTEVAGIAAQVKNETDLVVVVSHSGRLLDREMAKLDGVSLVIGGHNQILLDPPETFNGVSVCQAGEHGDYLGRLDVTIQSDKSVVVKNRFYKVTEELPEDLLVKKIVAKYADTLSDKLSQKVGQSLTPLDGVRAHIRWEETNLGNLIADSMRAITRAEIALINSGGIRASIPEGPITIEQVYQVLPFSNTLVTGSYTGEQIIAMLNRSASLKKEAVDGAFLQVSGLSFEIAKGKATQIRVGTELIQEKKEYRLAITDFMAAGGDGYHWCQEGKNMEDTGYPFNSLLIQYIQEVKTISPKIEGRILRKE